MGGLGRSAQYLLGKIEMMQSDASCFFVGLLWLIRTLRKGMDSVLSQNFFTFYLASLFLGRSVEFFQVWGSLFV